MTSWRFSVCLFAWLAAALGCDGGMMETGRTGPGDAGMHGGDAAVPPPGDAGTSSVDGGSPDTDAGLTPPSEIPGGEPGTAPIVGCEDADRPARALADPGAAVCDAIGEGRCFYVHPDGDDAAAGSFEAPLRTPQLAVRDARPGDVIYLRGGVYGESHAYATGVPRWDDPSGGVRREAFRIGRISLPDWAGGERFDVATGTEEAPIVIRSYPGERACFDGAGGISIGALGLDIAWWRVEDITLRRGGIHVGGGSGDGEQTHHITIARNEVYEHQGNERDNTGLVLVNRGDQGGPYEITVRSNILHDLYVVEDDGVRRDWSSTRDAQHFGGVTTLSCETYFGVGCGGNGRIVIENNHVYRVPSAFFFKNPAEGPFEVRHNVIHHVGFMGKWAPSNITFEGNLVHDAGGGILHGEFGGGDLSSEVGERAGRNLVLTGNTLVGLDNVVSFWVDGAGHTVRDNVIVGLGHSMSAASWDTPGYVSRHESFDGYPDSGADITGSALGESTFGPNCLVTPVDDFIAASRYRETGGSWEIDRLTLDEARSALGMEVDSVVVADAAEVLVDPSGGDYAVRADGACAGMGASR